MVKISFVYANHQSRLWIAAPPAGFLPRPSLVQFVAEVAVQGGSPGLVAIHTVFHGSRDLLPEPVPQLHRPVASGAGGPGGEMLLVAEEDEIGDLVDPCPGNGFAPLLVTFQQDSDSSIFAIASTMTGQAKSRGGKARAAASTLHGMAGRAIHPQLSVAAVAEGERLKNRLPIVPARRGNFLSTGDPGNRCRQNQAERRNQNPGTLLQ